MRKRKPAFPELEKQILMKGITKKEIAEALHITPECLSRKFTGIVDFNLKEIKGLHEIFPEISIEQLFGI